MSSALKEKGPLVFGLIIVIGLVYFITSTFLFASAPLDQEVLLEESDIIIENIETEEDTSSGEEVETIESIPYYVGIDPLFIQRNSIRTTFEDFNLQCDGDDCDIYFILNAEDTIFDDEKSKEQGNYYLRSPVFWHAYLYLYRGKMTSLFLCENEKLTNRSWSNTYCIDTEDLNKYYFGQKTRLIYTTKQLIEFEDLSPIEISKQSETFVFELTIPYEIYSEHS